MTDDCRPPQAAACICCSASAAPTCFSRRRSWLLVVFAAFASDAFLTQRNIVNISRQIVTNGFLSLGMLMVIRTGGIDLSVGSVLAFAGPAGHRAPGADAFLGGDRRRAGHGRRRSASSMAG